MAKRYNINFHSNQQGLLTRQFSEASDATLIKGTDSLSLGSIVRHAAGDGCITLSVGGKQFTTLRSTVNECAVLADHVVRAEQNKEVLLDGAIFIDRDPKHFVSQKEFSVNSMRRYHCPTLVLSTIATYHFPSRQRRFKIYFYRRDLYFNICEIEPMV
jgi:hypothetical protein